MSRNSNVYSHKYLRTSLFTKSEKPALKRNSNFSRSSRGLDRYREMADEINTLEKERNSFKKKLESERLLQLQPKKVQDCKQLLTDRNELHANLEITMKKKIAEVHRKYKTEIDILKDQIVNLETSIESALKEKKSYSYMYFREKEQSNALYDALRKKDDGYYTNIKDKFRIKREKYTANIHSNHSLEIDEKNKEIVRLNQVVKEMTQQIEENQQNYYIYENLVIESTQQSNDLIAQLEDKLNFCEEKIHNLYAMVREYESYKFINRTSKNNKDEINLKNNEILSLQSEIKDKNEQIDKLIQENESSKEQLDEINQKCRALSGKMIEIQNTNDHKIHVMDSKISFLTSELVEAHQENHELETYLQMQIQAFEKKSQNQQSCNEDLVKRSEEKRFVVPQEDLTNSELTLLYKVKLFMNRISEMKSKLKKSIANASKLESNLAHKEELLQRALLKNSQLVLHLKQIQLAYKNALSNGKLNKASLNPESQEELDVKDSTSEMVRNLTVLLDDYKAMSREIELKDEKLQFMKAENFKLYETCKSLDKKLLDAKSLSQEKTKSEHEEVSSVKDNLVINLQLECAELHSQVIGQSEKIYRLNFEYEKIYFEYEALMAAQQSTTDNKSSRKAQLSGIVKQLRPLKEAIFLIREELASFKLA